MATTHVQIALPAIQAAFVLIVTFFTVAKAYRFPSHLRGLKDVSQVVRGLINSLPERGLLISPFMIDEFVPS
jgi:hypothetical protein